LVKDAFLGAEKVSNAARGFVLSGDETTLKRRSEGLTEFRENMDKMQSLLQTEAGKKVFATAMEKAETVFAAQERAPALRRGGKSSEAATLLFAPELIQTRNDMDAAAKDLIARTNKLEEDANAARQATEDRAKMVAVTLMVVGIVL